MEKQITYKPKGTCSVKMDFIIETDNDTIKDMSVVGGCNGNLKGIRALLIGMKVQDVVAKLSGITCGFKITSCPDQMSKALGEYLEEKKQNA
ncbi:MAG: TIGR03905 family TSCPD domain-containing protein [Bacilli bacterium]